MISTFATNLWSFLTARIAAMCRAIVLSKFPVLQDPGLRLIEVNRNTISSKHLDVNEEAIVLKINNPLFWIRLVFLNDIGFAQSYMLGEIECQKLTEFFILLIKYAGTSSQRTLIDRFNGHISNLFKKANDVTQASLNANEHYSLSNDIFAAFLSPDMTYSCPRWSPKANDESLEDAQMTKLRSIIKKARIEKLDHVLEIGTGWGSFAILAVEMTGCRVTTLTLSHAQREFVEHRVKEAGLQNKIEVLLCDYREIPTTMMFDKVVSIEMIEHVGAAYVETYFECVHRHLKPVGGIGVFQTSTIPEARYESYKARRDFIQQYIFTGGHLTTVSHLVAAINKGAQGRLVVEEIQSNSGHYSRAIKLWSENFQKNFEQKIKPELYKQRMNDAEIEIFYRKWLYYFAYSSAGFISKVLGNVTITTAREGCTEVYERE